MISHKVISLCDTLGVNSGVMWRHWVEPLWIIVGPNRINAYILSRTIERDLVCEPSGSPSSSNREINHLDRLNRLSIILTRSMGFSCRGVASTPSALCTLSAWRGLDTLGNTKVRVIYK